MVILLTPDFADLILDLVTEPQKLMFDCLENIFFLVPQRASVFKSRHLKKALMCIFCNGSLPQQ